MSVAVGHLNNFEHYLKMLYLKYFDVKGMVLTKFLSAENIVSYNVKFENI
jgi:hypothetical protein